MFYSSHSQGTEYSVALFQTFLSLPLPLLLPQDIQEMKKQMQAMSKLYIVFINS